MRIVTRIDVSDVQGAGPLHPVDRRSLGLSLVFEEVHTHRCKYYRAFAGYEDRAANQRSAESGRITRALLPRQSRVRAESSSSLCGQHLLRGDRRAGARANNTGICRINKYPGTDSRPANVTSPFAGDALPVADSKPIGISHPFANAASRRDNASAFTRDADSGATGRRDACQGTRPTDTRSPPVLGAAHETWRMEILTSNWTAVA